MSLRLVRYISPTARRVSASTPRGANTTCYKPCGRFLTRLAAPVQSNAGGTAAAVILLGCSIGGTIFLYNQLHHHGPGEDAVGSQEEELTHNWIMVGSVLPGRPGNLTPEQEAKLQECWKATLRVFGVLTLDAGEVDDPLANGVSHAGSQEDLSASAEKKKKKRRFFSRKKYEDDDAMPSAENTEDKYGQTKEFQEALASSTPEHLRDSFWSMVKHDNPDGLLLRFLRARKWDVEKALVMMISTMHWRAEEMHVDDDIVKNGEEAALRDAAGEDEKVKREGFDFMAQLRLGKSFLHGSDAEDRPICFVRVRLHKQGEQTEASLERFTVHVIETARLLLKPPVDTAAIVFDMTGFSMANMDYGPVKFMINCFEANYPESLGVVLVHKAPWVFQGIWTIIKGWLDPVVAGKVHFTKSIDELAAYIPHSHLPHDFGGSEDWTYTYPEPAPGENAAMADAARRAELQTDRAATVRAYEAATRDWIQAGPAGADKAAAVARRAELAERLRAGYWVLDPYVRARTMYDRTGVIGANGRIEFYPVPVGNGVVESVGGGDAAAHQEKAAAVAVAVAVTGPVHAPDELD